MSSIQLGQITEKARDANVEVIAGFENRSADDDLSCRVGCTVNFSANNFHSDTFSTDCDIFSADITSPDNL